MSSSPLVQGLPRLEIDQDQAINILRIKPAYTLQRLVVEGVKQRAGRFYKSMMLPDYDTVYLLDPHEVAWGFDLLAEHPEYLANAVDSFMRGQKPEQTHVLDAGQPKQIMSILSSLMARHQVILQNESAAESLRALTWPRNGLPFMRHHSLQAGLARLRDSQIASLEGNAWIPQADPKARFLLKINQTKILVDLEENFAAIISQQVKSSPCHQFNSRQELSDWLHEIAGKDGKVKLLGWDRRLQLPKLSYLDSLREWTRYLQEADPENPPAQMQMAFDNDAAGAWAWLGGQAAFCEPVRHKMQGQQEDNSNLRLRMLMHQTGSLVHPGHPEQPHRLQNDAPGLEFYRPLNPFRSNSHGKH